MAMGDKIINQVVGKSMKDLAKVLESIHAHLEIQTRELIITRLGMMGKVATKEEIDGIIDEYQDQIN